MFGVSRQTLERLRKEYPSGTRVELIRLDDPYRKIPSGTIGTVEFVDDAGQLHGMGRTRLSCDDLRSG